MLIDLGFDGTFAMRYSAPKSSSGTIIGNASHMYAITPNPYLQRRYILSTSSCTPHALAASCSAASCITSPCGPCVLKAAPSLSSGTTTSWARDVTCTQHHANRHLRSGSTHETKTGCVLHTCVCCVRVAGTCRWWSSCRAAPLPAL